MVMQMKAKIKIMRNREKKKNITKDRPQKKNIKSNNIQEPSALSTNGILFHAKKQQKYYFCFLHVNYLFILTLCIVTIILDSKSPYISGFYLYILFSYSFNFQHLFVFFFLKIFIYLIYWLIPISRNRGFLSPSFSTFSFFRTLSCQQIT